MGKKLGEDEKVRLEDDSFEILDDDKQKMNYSWTEED